MHLVSMKTESEYEPSSPDCCPCVYLNHDQVEALGIKGVPAPGTVFTLQARAVAQSVTASAEDPAEGEGNAPDVSLSLKLTDMGLLEGRPAGEAASTLYGS